MIAQCVVPQKNFFTSFRFFSTSITIPIVLHETHLFKSGNEESLKNEFYLDSWDILFQDSGTDLELAVLKVLSPIDFNICTSKSRWIEWNSWKGSFDLSPSTDTKLSKIGFGSLQTREVRKVPFPDGLIFVQFWIIGQRITFHFTLFQKFYQ